MAKKFVLTVDYDDTVKKIKSMIESKEGIAVQQQRLIYSGRQLQDKSTLADQWVYNGCTLYLVLRLSHVKGQTMQMFSFIYLYILTLFFI